MCMCMLNRRTNILFEKEMLEKLAKIARQEKASVGELIRKAVRQIYLNKTVNDKKSKAYKKILTIRKRIKGIDYKEYINYGRKY